MKISILASLCAIGLLLASCAYQSSTFSPTAKANSEYAILYGRFTLGHQSYLKDKMALWLQNTSDHRNVYIYFDPDQPLKVMQVKAGRYQIAGFVGVNRTGEVIGRVSFANDPKTAAVAHPFDAPANSEVYLGDFTAGVTYDGVMREWEVDTLTNNFAGTSLEFREKYPNLRNVPVTSAVELPKQPSIDGAITRKRI